MNNFVEIHVLLESYPITINWSPWINLKIEPQVGMSFNSEKFDFREKYAFFKIPLANVMEQAIIPVHLLRINLCEWL